MTEQRTLDDLDAAYAEVRRGPYEFTWAGQHWSLPHLGELDYRLQAEIEQVGEKVNDVEYLEALFTRMFGEEQAARWAQVTVPTPVLFMLFDRWVKHAGGELGESPASTPSSGSTGSRSRRTSGGSTGSGSPRRSTAKTPTKRSPRKAAAKKAAAAPGGSTVEDQEWVDRHTALAGSLPESS